MHIVEVYYPGTWLDLPDPQLAHELAGILRYLEDRVVEAAIALSLFESAQANRIDLRAEFERDRAMRQNIDEQIRAEAGDAYFQNLDCWHLESERRLLRDKAQHGIPPRSYAHKVPFLHAHTFLYALDSFAKFLDGLCDYPGTPKDVLAIRDEFNAALPTLRKIRNSALHVEDRSRWYASAKDKAQGKRMAVSVMMLSFLAGDRLCYTIDDGTEQCVPITTETLSLAAGTLNRVLSSFPWKGPPPCITNVERRMTPRSTGAATAFPRSGPVSSNVTHRSKR